MLVSGDKSSPLYELVLLLTPGIMLGQEQGRKNLSLLLESCDCQDSRFHTLCEIYLSQFRLLAYQPESYIELHQYQEASSGGYFYVLLAPSILVLDKDEVSRLDVSLGTKPSLLITSSRNACGSHAE